MAYPYPDYNAWLNQTTADTRARLLGDIVRQLGDCFDRSTASALAYTRNAILNLQVNSMPDQWDSVRGNIEIACQTYQQQLANIVAGISAQISFGGSTFGATASATHPTTATSTSLLYAQPGNTGFWNNTGTATVNLNGYSNEQTFLQQIGTEVAQLHVHQNQTETQQAVGQITAKTQTIGETKKKKTAAIYAATTSNSKETSKGKKTEIKDTDKDKKNNLPEILFPKLVPGEDGKLCVPYKHRRGRIVKGFRGFLPKKYYDRPLPPPKPPKLTKKARAELRAAEKAKAAKEAAKAEREAKKKENPPKPKIKKEVITYKCGIKTYNKPCTHLAVGKRNLDIHVKNAHGYQPNRCYAIGCRASFAKPATLTEHVNTKHLHLTDWPCPHQECKRVFTGHVSLRVHYQNMHQEGQFFCPECDQLCTTMYKLRAHRKTHGSGEAKANRPDPFKARLQSFEAMESSETNSQAEEQEVIAIDDSEDETQATEAQADVPEKTQTEPKTVETPSDSVTVDSEKTEQQREVDQVVDHLLELLPSDI